MYHLIDISIFVFTVLILYQFYATHYLHINSNPFKKFAYKKNSNFICTWSQYAVKAFASVCLLVMRLSRPCQERMTKVPKILAGRPDQLKTVFICM